MILLSLIYRLRISEFKKKYAEISGKDIFFYIC